MSGLSGSTVRIEIAGGVVTLEWSPGGTVSDHAMVAIHAQDGVRVNIHDLERAVSVIQHARTA